ncbi:hypothetical protein CYY_009051 [Polysphondylium violaceum]|uniref:RING-type domain-containing protein n=1 Tax=Polysphondylium violaceum TaxID=133409 RepID=A0A8J4PPJ2_9MYCE|nr:hypothetical protein CYY_009051 [Polysphondylium violaceum]
MNKINKYKYSKTIQRGSDDDNDDDNDNHSEKRTIGPGYDSDEEKDFLLIEERNFLLKEQNRDDNNNNNNNNSENNNSNSNNNISPSTTSTTSTITTTTTTSTSNHTTINIEENNSNNNERQEQQEQEQQEQDNQSDQEYFGEIGEEAAQILLIQTELTDQMPVLTSTKRVSIVGSVYLLFVNTILLTVLVMDWNHSCEYPFKQWSITQFVIQSLMLINFLFLYINLPDEDFRDPDTPSMKRSYFIFKVLHRIIVAVWITWFFIGGIYTLKARAKEACDSSMPYLTSFVYSLILFEFLVLMFSFLLFLLNVALEFIRLYFTPIELRNQAGGGTDTNGGGGINNLNEPRGATDTMIRNLPVHKFTPGYLEEEDSSCAICLSDYVQDDKIRILPCKHHFHLECVDRWLIINKTCPFCKRDISLPNNNNSSTNKSIPQESE